MMAILDRPHSLPMSTDGGDRVSGAQFRQRREQLKVTREEMAAFSGVSLRALVNFEAAQAQPTDETYWRLVDTLTTLEAGGAVTATMRRHPTRGGVIVAHELTDPDEANRALDDIRDTDR